MSGHLHKDEHKVDVSQPHCAFAQWGAGWTLGPSRDSRAASQRMDLIQRSSSSLLLCLDEPVTGMRHRDDAP